MTNLKEETLRVLKLYNKSISDIRWIGNSNVEIPIDAFFDAADREYDAGYGGTEVCEGLMIVGDDWWLERHDYDGAEWWEFKTVPQRPWCKEEENILPYIFSDFDF